MANRLSAAIFLGGTLLLSACAGTKQYVPFPEGREGENASAAEAQIYVMRPTVFGSAVSLSIHDGLRRIGKLGPGGYVAWQRAPGATVLASKVGSVSTEVLDLHVEAGETYYVHQHLTVGFMAPHHVLEQLSPTEGLAILRKCKKPKVKITEQQSDFLRQNSQVLSGNVTHV